MPIGRRQGLALAALLATAISSCATEYHPEYHPETSVLVTQNIYAAPMGAAPPDVPAPIVSRPSLARSDGNDGLLVPGARANEVAVDGDAVYWVSDYHDWEQSQRSVHVFKREAAGAPLELARWSGMKSPWVRRLLVHGDTVYVATTAGVFGVPTNGGAVAPVALDETGARAVAVDESAVYWLGGDCNVRSLDKKSGAVTTIWSPAHAQRCDGAPGYIAVDDTDVYFNVDASGSEGKSLYAMAKSGARARRIANDRLDSLFVAASAVFWVRTRHDDRTLEKWTKPSGPLSEVAPVGDSRGLTTGGNALVSDGQDVVWIEPLYQHNVHHTRIMRAPIGGGTAREVALTDGIAVEIALSPRLMAWTNGIGDGSLFAESR